jgi:mycothiol maleylpyruvate isomerase-like protein
MDLREEHLERERTAWEAFLSAVGEVPADRLDDRTVVPGWSAKDLVWHNGGWAAFVGEQLQGMIDAPFVDPFAGHDDAHWDGVNEEMVREGRAVSFDEALAAAERQRAAAREVWSSLPEVDEQRAGLFADETFVHYEEHTAEIRAFVERGPALA